MTLRNSSCRAIQTALEEGSDMLAMPPSRSPKSHNENRMRHVSNIHPANPMTPVHAEAHRMSIRGFPARDLSLPQAHAVKVPTPTDPYCPIRAWHPPSPSSHYRLEPIASLLHTIRSRNGLPACASALTTTTDHIVSRDQNSAAHAEEVQSRWPYARLWHPCRYRGA